MQLLNVRRQHFADWPDVLLVSLYGYLIPVQTCPGCAVADRCAEFFQDAVRQFFLFGIIDDFRCRDDVAGDAFHSAQLVGES